MDRTAGRTGDFAFVVVVVHDSHDVSRTTFASALEAEEYAEALRRQGVPEANIRLYRTRLARPIFPSF